MARLSLAFALLCGLVAGAATSLADDRSIVLATTTATQESGLLDYLLPIFRDKAGIEVTVIARARRRGARRGATGRGRCRADARAACGGEVRRRRVWRETLRRDVHRLCADRAEERSRGCQGQGHRDGAEGDRSQGRAICNARRSVRHPRRGTRALDRSRGSTSPPPRAPWYREAGQGMASALHAARAANAYLLADRGSWIAFKDRGDLDIVVEGDRRLLNQYGVMLVNPAKFPNVKKNLAQDFIDWLTSPEGQTAIAGYKVDGQQLSSPIRTGPAAESGIADGCQSGRCMVHQWRMTQRLPPSLTPLDTALAALLRGVDPVAPVEVPLADAIGCIATGTPLLAACPSRDVAAADGWALSANDLVGASAYAPLLLKEVPPWVEVGDAMPAGFDCVLDADAVEVSGPLVQVQVDGVPGQGRPACRQRHRGRHAGRRRGPSYCCGRSSDCARSRAWTSFASGGRGLRIVNVPGGTATMHMIAGIARAAGLDVEMRQARARDDAAIADALDASPLRSPSDGRRQRRRSPGRCYHGPGPARRGDGRTALRCSRDALPRSGGSGKFPSPPCPVRPIPRFGAWLSLVLPLVDRLSARRPRQRVTLPLARKIGIQCRHRLRSLCWRRNIVPGVPLAVGEWPLQAIARADAWLLVSASDEGFAAGNAGRCPSDAGRDMGRGMTMIPEITRPQRARTGSSFLKILSREEALARFEGGLVPRALLSEKRKLRCCFGRCARRRHHRTDRCAAVRPLQCRPALPCVPPILRWPAKASLFA